MSLFLYTPSKSSEMRSPCDAASTVKVFRYHDLLKHRYPCPRSQLGLGAPSTIKSCGVETLRQALSS
jgi:hypothetical protein